VACCNSAAVAPPLRWIRYTRQVGIVAHFSTIHYSLKLSSKGQQHCGPRDARRRRVLGFHFGVAAAASPFRRSDGDLKFERLVVGHCTVVVVTRRKGLVSRRVPIAGEVAREVPLEVQGKRPFLLGEGSRRSRRSSRPFDRATTFLFRLP
jgi:hypothetical protein